MFPRQTIHTTSALLHAIIALADLSNMSGLRLNEPNGEIILTNETLLADNFRKSVSFLFYPMHSADFNSMINP
jgi:hypothetical protein